MVTQPASEAQLVKRIAKALDDAYPMSWVFKVVGHPYQMSGVPDIILCINGLMIAIEVKWQRPGETKKHAEARVTKQQEFQMCGIHNAGGITGVVTTVEEAIHLVTRGLALREKFQTAPVPTRESALMDIDEGFKKVSMILKELKPKMKPLPSLKGISSENVVKIQSANQSDD